MKTVNKALGWTDQRIQWNKEGWCSREACKAKHTNRLNTANNLLYCDWCAEKINEANPGMVNAAPEEETA